MSDIRIGKISSVNYQTGMAKVVYEDREGKVTKELPCLSMNNEVFLPNPGEKVVVAYLSNGQTAAVILGTVFNQENPACGSKGIYKKKIRDNVVVQYDDSSQTLTIQAPHVKIVTEHQSVDWQ